MRGPVSLALALLLAFSVFGTATCYAVDSSATANWNPYLDQSVTTPKGVSSASNPFSYLKGENVENVIKQILARYEKLLVDLKQRLAKAGAAGKTTSYTVVSGDYLTKIAGKLLGDPSRWKEIVELNKNKYPSLAKNPNLIYPGWVLTIPGTSGTSTTTVSNGGNTTPGSSRDSAALNAWKGGKLSPSEFGRLLGPAARESMKRTGIPASVTLAQAALETGWGKATIGDAKNLFGMKGTGPAGSITVSTQEYVNGRYVTIRDNFRKYNNWSESFDDHARLISQGSRYRNSMANKGNPDQFARELQKAGYATSPTYASTLISIMKSNNFYQFDK